ncbi:carbohydrate ABC transporter permease [Herbiconiux sp. P17]|uniref:carbohydrate ABC transporter permease n=1 Tax=Herbiconiux wuyangfengii TaxID=3342794 RepID=UPI0035B8A5E0
MTTTIDRPPTPPAAPAPVAPPRRKSSSYARKDRRLAVFLLLPAAVTIFTVMIVPLGFAIYASFFDYSLGQEDNMAFVFLDNYARFFTDPVALRSLLNTVLFTVLSLALCITIGVGIAVLLRSLNPKVANVLRAVFAMPVLVSPIIVSLIWRYMYDPTYGLVYYLLGLVGLQDFGGLTNSATALFCIVVTDVWHAAPFIILVAAAGLTVIPEELYEAARIDGASAPRMLFNITLPLMTKVLVVLVLIRGTDAFRVFDLIYGLTGGGPANSTTSLSIYAYKQAFENNQMGYAMASAVVTLICLIVLFGPFLRNSARGKND